MDSPKAKHLFKAARAGDAAKVRELRAAGAPLEATDLNGLTPLMAAAQAGQAETFHALVEAGANLHALGLDQTDLLECAAQGGNAEIVRFLLERGLPVEGHWQPRSQAARREGHITPLMNAALNGHVAAVRVLLQAGADRNAKFDGQTALKMVKGEIAFPIVPGRAERKQDYIEIAALLADASPARDESEDAAAREAQKFAANARQPAFVQLREKLTQLCGPGRPWGPVPDHGIAAAAVVAFTLRRYGSQQTLDDLQEEARQAGVHLILTEPWIEEEDAELALFPTADKFAVVAAVGTEGANYGVQTADVLAWLHKLDQENPFALRCCGHDLVGGAFIGRVKGSKKVAERMVEMCPPLLDEGFETADELARALGKGKTFLLRWD